MQREAHTSEEGGRHSTESVKPSQNGHKLVVTHRSDQNALAEATNQFVRNAASSETRDHPERTMTDEGSERITVNTAVATKLALARPHEMLPQFTVAT